MRKFVSTWVGFAHHEFIGREGKSFKTSGGVCWWKRCVEVCEEPPFLMLIYSRYELISLFFSSLTTPKCGRQNFPKDHVDVNKFLFSFDQLWWKTRRWCEKLREGFRIHIQLDVAEARNCQILQSICLRTQSFTLTEDGKLSLALISYKFSFLTSVSFFLRTQFDFLIIYAFHSPSWENGFPIN